MPVFEDWLKSPLSIINNIFDSDPINFDSKVKEYFEKKLKSEKNYYSIPSLNEVPIHELTSNCLVRYRCMIQDSFDPVYYSGTHLVRNKKTNEKNYMTFKYKETFDLSEDYELCEELNKENINEKEIVISSIKKLNQTEEANNYEMNCFQNEHQNLQQRMTFYCVPIPGESEWVKTTYKSFQSAENSNGSSSNTSHRPSKRTIDCEENTEMDNYLIEVTNNKCTDELIPALKQANIQNGNENDSEDLNKETICMICSRRKANSSKISKTSNTGQNTKPEENFSFNLNFPLSMHETGTACLVKIYENFENYKINDLVEFIGIYSQDPSLAYMYDDNSDASHSHLNDEQMSIHQVPTSMKQTSQNQMEIDTNHSESNVCHCNDAATNPPLLSMFPPSLVPRLHCIKSFHLFHNNPILNKIHWKENFICFDSDLNEEQSKKESSKSEYWNKQMIYFLHSLMNESNGPDFKLSPTVDSILLKNSNIHLLKLRNELINSFQELLFGDSLAAEYLLMHMLSSVFMRRDVTILGKFSLNLTNVPGNSQQDNHKLNENSSSIRNENQKSLNNHFPYYLFKAIKQLSTMSHLFQLTIDNLNKSNMIPCKDYNKDKLITGMLQLPDSFHLVIDETCLNTGELNQKGLINFNSIKDIINWQKLNYDFSYHQQEFHKNMRVLILSKTKSILPSDCELKLNPSLEFDANKYEISINKIFENNDLINKFRNYLAVMARQEYKIPEPIQKIVEDDIVHIRKNFIETNLTKDTGNLKEKVMCIEDIHLLLIVARLQSLSYGLNELGLNEWNIAKSLEYERLNKRN